MTEEDYGDRTDAQLLRGSLTDGRLFGVIYVRYAPSVLRWVESRVYVSHVAQELTAETFAQALQHRRRFRAPADGSAAPWLFGIADKLIKTWVRKQRVEETARRKVGVPLDLLPGVEEELAHRADVLRQAHDLRQALARLPTDQREAVLLRVVHGQSYPAIAAHLNISADNARMRAGRGLKTLRAFIEGENR